MKPDGLRVLRLNLKKKYWVQIQTGAKNEEYREQTEYWDARLCGRDYDEVWLLCGYPKRNDEGRLIRVRWRGAVQDRITHEEFGPRPVYVYRIDVSEKIT